MQFAYVDDLADVVGVVGADVGDARRWRRVSGVGGFHGFLQFCEDGVESFDGFGPLRGVEVIEGFVVVAAEGLGLFAFQVGEFAGVPEEKVVGELAYGVVGGSWVVGAAFGGGDPARLLGGEAGDGGVDGDEPLGFVVGRAELGEEEGFQGRCRGWGGLARGLGLGLDGGEGEGREQDGKEDGFGRQ